MFRAIGLLSVLLGLGACGTEPSATTHNGQPCHAIGYPWAQAKVTPDSRTLCW